MDTDLMGAPGLQHQPEKGIRSIPVKDLIMGPGGLAIGADLLPDVGIVASAQGGVHQPGGRGGTALAYRQIFPKKVSAVELFGYASEDEARKDMGLDGSLYEGLADEMVSQFRSVNLNVTPEVPLSSRWTG